MGSRGDLPTQCLHWGQELAGSHGGAANCWRWDRSAGGAAFAALCSRGRRWVVSGRSCLLRSSEAWMVPDLRCSGKEKMATRSRLSVLWISRSLQPVEEEDDGQQSIWRSSQPWLLALANGGLLDGGDVGSRRPSQWWWQSRVAGGERDFGCRWWGLHWACFGENGASTYNGGSEPYLESTVVTIDDYTNFEVASL